ncbi:prepilin-type N-terminal cleavage/methylation domain-containing protein [Luteolibacter ambystomatis]|uniref:Prepilin-type N-terminal cleavage/methylation domain-containing protein n=1 Tax=Luteolibacter ambystomatis TaxID=2824561 RepID=A0A975IYX9_9BACT|nr:prepilin-type N-terminal cleavage/methylation domain-containing protein [Luteolibacter ambystomatis]QUE50353.1 prepilin-type N-terminal cleavage/methylation domain-containing protein [Luteolibacter ambystomatis]
MRSRGFTLVELLVTITIIVVLAAISTPLVSRGLAKSKQAACLGKLRNIGVGVESYLQDNNRKMPPLAASRESKEEEVKVLETELVPYLSAPDAFQCPADGKEYKKTGCSYIWNSAVSGQLASNLSFLGKDGRPQAIPLVADKESWHPEPKGTNILYADFTASSDLKFTTSTPGTSTP